MWEKFLAVQADNTENALPNAQRLGSRDGWEYLRLPFDEATDTGSALNDLGHTVSAPVIGADIADSDAAVIFYGGADGIEGWLPINAAYGDDDLGTEHSRRWIDLDERRESADLLAHWARRYAPAKPKGEEIVSALDALVDEKLSADLEIPSLVFAEDGVRAVFELLGFRSLDDTVFSVEPS